MRRLLARARLRDRFLKRINWSLSFVIVLVIVVVLIIALVWLRETSPPPPPPLHLPTPPIVHGVAIRPFNESIKTILIWNDFFGVKHFGLSLGHAIFSGCKVKTCHLWDRLDDEPDLPHDSYDALVFHGIDTGPSSIRDLPLRRRPGQRYIFLLQESPIMRPTFYNLKNFFNWTATYRRDSDFHMPFVAFKRKDGPRYFNKHLEIWMEPNFQNITTNLVTKTKLVVWFVSNPNTQSKRDLYVTELSRYIHVDIYGEGRLTCSRTEKNCDLMLDTTYKFYLAFENSLCEDYVTEKFSRALNHNIIPVVYGGANYSNIAPPLSYIDVKDFSSPRALARYLHYLDKNPHEYKKYFWWKDFYQQDGGYLWCDVCERLNDPRQPNRVYTNMQAWWSYPGVCSNPQDFFEIAS